MTAPVGTMPRFSKYTPAGAENLNVIAREVERQGRAVKASRSTTFPIPDSILTRTPLQTENLDTAGGGGWDPLTPLFETVTVGGAWLFLGQVRFSASATATMTPQIVRGTFSPDNVMAAGPTVNSVSSGVGPTGQVWAFDYFAAGEQLSLAAYQNSGSAMLARVDFGGTFLAGVYLGGGSDS